MMGATHAVIGVTAGMLIALNAGANHTQLVSIAGLCALSALLPDIDHPKSRIRNGLGAAGHVAFFWIKHRGITHTLLALAAISLVSLYYLPGPHGLAVIAGYASHIIADTITRSGTPLLWPLYRQPLKVAVIRTGGIAEYAIRGVLLFVIGYLTMQMV